jgi:hypothetical protein
VQERAGLVLPFVIAVLMPPAGLLLGLVATAEDRALGLRIVGVSILAGAIWALLLFA